MHCRFIPAYAGNSEEKLDTYVGMSVHPRLRGELLGVAFSPVKIAGSSPLTRGTRLPRHEKRYPCAVHPRLRGELAPSLSEVLRAHGSSPLTRGTPKNNVRWYLNGRFIPAYAGNSS